MLFAIGETVEDGKSTFYVLRGCEPGGCVASEDDETFLTETDALAALSAEMTPSDRFDTVKYVEC